MSPIVLDQAVPSPRAQELLRASLADAALRVIYRRAVTGTWIDESGVHVGQEQLEAERMVTPLERDGDWIAALVHDASLPTDTPQVQATCQAIVHLIDQERITAELRALLRDEQASRARIVAASDRRRRSFEQNLHDGAQQRLVGLAVMLRLARNRADGEGELAELFDDAAAEVDDAIADLRELARGLHPAIVNDAGLAAAVESLAETPGIPVELSIELPRQVPEPVSIAAYYLVAESIANANKHSGATLITVSLHIADGKLHVAVSDDGSGGAVTSGSGITGLADRVGALGGRVTVDSEPGRGTTVTAAMPLRPAPSLAGNQVVDDVLLRLPGGDAQPRYTPGTARHAPSVRGDLDRRRRALKWIAWQNLGAPGELIDVQPEEEDLLYARALLLFVGGNTKINKQRRDWVIGYLTAAGYSEETLAAAAEFDDGLTMDDIMAAPRMPLVQKVLLYDALRACAMDTLEPAPDGFDPVLRVADSLGIPREVVAELHEIVLQEAALRRRRHEIVVLSAMPKLLNDTITELEAASTRSGRRDG